VSRYKSTTTWCFQQSIVQIRNGYMKLCSPMYSMRHYFHYFLRTLFSYSTIQLLKYQGEEKCKSEVQPGGY
jgi:uncharacterized protein YbgA (DUF1722 family)